MVLHTRTYKKYDTKDRAPSASHLWEESVAPVRGPKDISLLPSVAPVPGVFQTFSTKQQIRIHLRDAKKSRPATPSRISSGRIHATSAILSLRATAHLQRLLRNGRRPRRLSASLNGCAVAMSSTDTARPERS